MKDTIYRQDAIDRFCKRCDLVSEDAEPCTEKCNDIKILEMMQSAQPELIEKVAYIRGFEQGRTQGMIDAQERKKMNRQRKVVITVTYNEMGIIIDTKAEELGSSAQPEPQWIPYSSAERPKDREEVMVTIDDGYKRYTDTDEYVDGKFWYHDENNVVAWKPFDEPWEGEQP